jgi:hypothetical protein
LAGVYALAAPPLPGAIFTTTVDGTIVNENVRYEAKEDVYLDGGPGPNAPSSAAGLPEGDYYFQVTDPSGKDLLSTDHISCRKIHVNANGVIDFVYEGINYTWVNGKDAGWIPEDCKHNQGVDQDHSELGAITVQLYPYDDTPNPGGVYKVWITPVGDYAGPAFDPDGDKKQAVNGELWQPGNVHGFIPSKSKTDNYKVKKKGKPFDPPEITVRKFHDKNLNGVQDTGEEDVTSWEVTVTDPLSIEDTIYTPWTILAEPSGTWTVTEATPAGTLQTVSFLDGAVVSLYPDADPTVLVEVAGESGETHEVVFGNVGLGSIKACKVYDRNANGVADEGEPGVEGWRMQLTGTDDTGAAVGPIVQTTGADGCTTFADLLPGTYTVTELIPTGSWVSTGSTSYTVTIESSLDGTGSTVALQKVTFTNYCEGVADFGTKGYWHNKNGLQELTEDLIVTVNGLAPYISPSSYFGAGDEPFDGKFEDGTDVAEAFKDNNGTDSVAPAGTWQAEVSHFLIDANAGGDPREQLAQQLLAFIFNANYRLDDPGAVIELPDGTMTSASALIAAAIAAWESGTAEDQNAIKDVLDTLNNSDAVKFVKYDPCPVVY